MTRSSAGAAGPTPAVGLDQRKSAFPCGDAGAPEEVGLALSGGGYRATLFHLGALWRLNELGWLGRIDRISTVSGGSLMAGILARSWSGFDWDADGRVANFEEKVIKPTLAFTGRRIDAFVIVLGLVPLINPANVMARVLDVVLTGRLRLSELPDRPRFVFNAANLGTAVSWRFSKPYMGDSRIGIICKPDVPVARAVAASAAYPPFVAPLVLKIDGLQIERVRGATLLDDSQFQELRKRVLLLDGGAYDNLGIESVEGRCRIVLASDAGGNFRPDARDWWPYHFWWPLVRRTLDMAVEGGRAQRRRALIDRAQLRRAILAAGGEPPNDDVTEHVALWRTSLELEGHPMLPAGWSVADHWGDYISRLSTRMWPMRKRDQQRTINWGYLTSDVVLRRRIPALAAAPGPTQLPYPDSSFGTAPR